MSILTKKYLNRTILSFFPFFHIAAGQFKDNLKDPNDDFNCTHDTHTNEETQSATY